MVEIYYVFNYPTTPSNLLFLQAITDNKQQTTDNPMIKSKLNVFSLLILFLSLGAWGCTNANKTTRTDTASKNRDELQEKPIQQPAKNLYLMLRLAQDDSTGVINVLTVEKQVYEKQGNPLPVNSDIKGKQLFTCEIKQQNGETIRKSEQKINFTIGESQNEAFLKFILPLPENADYVEVNHLNEKGVWIKLYTEKI